MANRRMGVSTLPTMSTTLEGLRDKKMEHPKNARVNRREPIPGETGRAPKKGSIASSKETAPVRGMANNGPSIR